MGLKGRRSETKGRGRIRGPYKEKPSQRVGTKAPSGDASRSNVVKSGNEEGRGADQNLVETGESCTHAAGRKIGVS